MNKNISGKQGEIVFFLIFVIYRPKCFQQKSNNLYGERNFKVLKVGHERENNKDQYIPENKVISSVR